MLIVAAVIVLFAAFVRATSGFGQALIATPLLTLIMGAKDAVVISIILNCITSILVLWHIRQHVDLRRAAFIGLGSIFGVPIGAFLLSTLDQQILKLVIAALVIPFSVLLLLGHSHRFKNERLGCILAGLASGTLAASTSLGGPPVVLFLANQGLVKERFVGTLAAYFLFSGIISIIAISPLGLVTTDLLINVAALIPPLWLGSYAGIKVLPKINVNLFRKIVPLIVSIIGLVIIITVLTDL